ncbi:hypothetical protein B0H13DRAFT_2041903 [Mycena leptocephala]|nr:hypothetical protein B0H13DRAFT_2041903 [Mycena leptocephala]
MSRRSQSSDNEGFTFNIEDYIDTSSLYAVDAPTSSSHPTALRCHSFGEQYLPPYGEPFLFPGGGPRRRAQSDNPPFMTPSISTLQTTMTLMTLRCRRLFPSVGSPPITVPHPQQAHLRACPVGRGMIFTPASPRHAKHGPGSDTSSARSVSPSPSRSGFISPSLLSPDPDGVPSRWAGGAGHETTLRGRLTRRGDRPKLRQLHSIGLSARTLFKLEGLSIEDETPAEQSYSNYDSNSGVSPYDTSQSSGYLPHLSSPGGGLSVHDDWGSPYLRLPGSSNDSIRSSSSLSSNYDSLEFSNYFREGFEGSSSDAGRSRSHSHVPGFDADYPSFSHGDAERRRLASPYLGPIAGPSTGQAEGWNLEDIGPPGGESAGSFLNHGTELMDMNPPTSHSNSSNETERPAHIQDSTGLADDFFAPDHFALDEPAEEKRFRPVVATVAGRRASAARRKDKNNPGAFVCDICNADFTAKHNLRNHMNSHNLIKTFVCGICGESFGTKHTMKRHERKCSERNSKIEEETIGRYGGRSVFVVSLSPPVGRGGWAGGSRDGGSGDGGCGDGGSGGDRGCSNEDKVVDNPTNGNYARRLARFSQLTNFLPTTTRAV